MSKNRIKTAPLSSDEGKASLNHMKDQFDQKEADQDIDDAMRGGDSDPPGQNPKKTENQIKQRKEATVMAGENPGEKPKEGKKPEQVTAGGQGTPGTAQEKGKEKAKPTAAATTGKVERRDQRPKRAAVGNQGWKYLTLVAIIIAIVAVAIAALNPGPQGPAGPQGPKGEPGQTISAATPASSVTPAQMPTTPTSNSVSGAEIRALLQRTFPAATLNVSQNSYRLYPVQQFTAFMQQEYTSGNYSRFVTRTASYTKYDACGAADQLIARAQVALSGIATGKASLNDASKTYFIAIFLVDNQLKVKSFAPLDGQLLSNDTQMQRVEIH